jgi:hypothetical protein
LKVIIMTLQAAYIEMRLVIKSYIEECRFLGCYTVWLLKGRRFGGVHRLHHQGDKNRRARNNVSSNYQLNRSVLRFLLTASVVSSSPILMTLMKEAVVSPKRRLLQEPHMPEDAVLCGEDGLNALR